MTSEIRANTLKNRVGLGTVSFTNTGTVVSGIVTANTLRLPDSTSGSLGRVQLGNGLDLSLYHDGTNSFLINNTGYLSIQSQDGVGGIFIARNAELNLYYGGSVRLQTSSSGVTINRDIDVDGHTNLDNVSIAGVTTHSDDVKFTGNNYNVLWDKSDNSLKFDALAKIKLADSFQFYHNTNGVIHNTSGVTFIYGSGSGNISIQAQSGSQNIACVPNGGTSLYYQGNQKLYTVSDGVYIHNNLGIQDSIQHILDTNTKIRFPADDNISFETGGTERLRINSNGLTVPDGDVNNNFISVGDSQDLKIFHDGSHSYIRDIGTGGLRITTNSFNVLNSSNGESMITGTEDGAVKLYYDHNLRLETSGSRTIFRGSGGIGVYGDSGSNQNGQISLHPTGSAVYTNLFFYNAAGNSYASIIGHDGGTLFFTGGTNGPLRHRVNGTGFHSFQDGNTQRVTITASGSVNIGGNFTQTSAPLSVTTDANDYGIRLLTGSNVVFDAINNDSAGNCEVRGYYNNNSGTQGMGFRLEANGETFFNPGGITGLSVKSTGQTTLTRGSQGGRDSTGNNSNFFKIGTWYGIDQTSRLKITVFGTMTYDSNTNVAGETIIYISNNANNTMKGHFHTISNERGGLQKVAFKMGGSNTNAEVWVKYNGGYSCLQHKVDASEGYWVGTDVDTGSTSVPSGATEATAHYGIWLSNGSQSYERLRITSAGQTKLNISSNNALTEPLVIRNGGSGGGTDVGMLFYNGNESSSGAGALARIKALDVGGYDSDLVFETGLKSGWSNTTIERLRITSDGKIGINQVPTRELSLHSPDNNNALIHFTNDDTGETSSDGILVGLDGNENMVINNQESGRAIIGYTYESGDATREKFRISHDGAVRLYSYKGNNTDTPGITFRGGSTTQSANFALIHSRMVSNWGGQLQFKVKDDNGSLSDAYRTAMIMNHNAYVTKPEHPAFFATHTGTDGSTSDGNLIELTTTRYNKNNVYSTSNYYFTAPVAGVYTFTGQVWAKNGTSHARWQFSYHNGSSWSSITQHGFHGNSVNKSDFMQNASITYYMNSGDRMGMRVDNGPLAYYRGGSGAAHTYFCGHLVG